MCSCFDADASHMPSANNHPDGQFEQRFVSTTASHIRHCIRLDLNLTNSIFSS